MARRYKARKSVLQIILLTLLWMILIPVILSVVLAGSLYIYLNVSGFSYDTPEDIALIAAERPMETAQRYVAVDPAASSFTVAVNKSDVYWVAERENLLKPLVFDAEDTLAKYDFELDKYGLYMEDGRLFVTARLLLKGFLYVPIRAELSPGVQNGELAFYLKAVNLGRAISIPLERLGFSENADPVYTLEADTHPRMKKLIDATLSGDTMHLVFAFDPRTDLFDEAKYLKPYFFNRLDYLSCDAARIRLEAAGINPDYDYGVESSALRAALDRCAAEPAYLLDLKVQALCVAMVESTLPFFAAREADYCARFSPTLTEETAAARREEYDASVRQRTAALSALATALYEACCDGRITLDVDMVYLDNAAFTASALMGEHWADYSGWLDETKIVPVVAEELTARNAPNPAKTAGLPLLSDMVVSKAAAKGLDLATNKRCPLGLLVELPSGVYRWLYLSDSDEVRNEPVDGLLYQALSTSAAVPHWRAVDTGITQILSDAAFAAGYSALDQVETLPLGETVTDLQYPAMVQDICTAIQRFLPALQTLDLTENPYVTRNIRSIFSSRLPNVEILYPEG